ncbi:MAG: HAMP domain-containing histidine kinase [Eubacterium sp.]|nr:HAMP domain-containing histidine kinase [Eubacterium sp.]
MKFRTKAACCMILLMALFFAAGGSALISVTFHTSLQQEKASAHESYRMILNTLQIVNSMDEWTDEKDISKILEQLSSQDSFGAALQLHSQTELLYSKGAAAAHFKNLSEQIDTTHLACAIFYAPDTRYYLQLSGSFFVGREIYYLDAAYDISSIYEARTQQQDLYQQIFLILTAACACFSYILAFFLTRPLARLSKASREIACGNYDYRSRVRTNDEVGAVSRDFDLMADHLQNSIEELQDTMERQNQFIGNFTHELKTPMTSIIGYADLLRSQTLSKEDEADAAKYIFTEGKRLEHLSLKLLDIFVSQHEAFTLAKASPSDIITRLVAHLQPVLAREQILLECDCEEGYCMLDTDFFGSLLVNLIENARKALSENGRILVSSVMTTDGCLVKVTDNGQGMPRAALSHLTEAFYRVDKARSRAQGGAGLGLTLCAEIARRHGGMILFESEEGRGTTVTVTLKGGRA